MSEAVSLLKTARSKLKGRGEQCTIDVLIRTNPAADIQGLLDNTGKDEQGDPRGEGIPYSVSAETLNEAFGTKMDYQPISRHIRGKCRCGK